MFKILQGVVKHQRLFLVGGASIGTFATYNLYNLQMQVNSLQNRYNKLEICSNEMERYSNELEKYKNENNQKV